MLEVKEALKKAREYFKDVYEEEIELKNLMLEEVNLDEHSKEWRITFGFDDNRRLRTPNNPLAAMTGVRPVYRVYKTVKIDADSGQPMGISIREV